MFSFQIQKVSESQTFLDFGRPVFEYLLYNCYQFLRYCPWCEDPGVETGFRAKCSRDTRKNIFVLDDRLYDYIENFPRPKNAR